MFPAPAASLLTDPGEELGFSLVVIVNDREFLDSQSFVAGQHPYQNGQDRTHDAQFLQIEMD
jgi:hypothetical protein